jgi:DNA mismatch endonuclease (patch repair protein)
MTDVVSKAVRSRMMSSIRGRGTRPEMAVRRYLHGRGFRYRLHDRSLPGTPDLVLPRYKAVIFVHGCFWHRHAGCHLAATPASNQEFWLKKLSANAERDQRNLQKLLRDGWRVIVIWECGIRLLGKSENLDWLPTAIRTEEYGIMEWPLHPDD